MTKANADERAAAREEGRAQRPEDRVPTYQELVDEAVEDTFPASDPIAPGAAAHPGRQVKTAKDETDWSLQPGAAPATKREP
jgi:hypothetical protein